ncbi:MAG: signal recognition particle-docking protein FtsY [Bacteroidales bacterium]|nr:signal recognition particle-docking protein FtsY [Bacteroidales bacterium]
MKWLNLFSKEKKEKIENSLTKTKESFFKKIKNLIFNKPNITEQTLDEIEETLISADVGIKTTIKIINNIKEYFDKNKIYNEDDINQHIKQVIADIMIDAGEIKDFSFVEKHKPYVFMIVGVNGVGKTTTIAKLAYQFKKINKRVLLGAADTFRAAAIDQLSIWADRVGVPIIKQKMGADPAAVAFDTLNSALKNNFDVVIIDTAGRLHNKVNLMNELSKIRRVMQKVIPDAPHEVLLILDATTGQNAFEQARQFLAATQVNAICVTKLDGTAKGGVVIGISHEFNIPVKYIGIGESLDDIEIFNKYAFVESLFS